MKTSTRTPKQLLNLTNSSQGNSTVSLRVNRTERSRDALAPIVSNLPLMKRKAFGFISETAIQYRSSPVVADYGGDGELRAGDRLPDLPMRSISGRTSLLGGWTTPRHRIFGLNLDEADIETLKSDLQTAEVIALASADFDDAGRKLLGDDGKLIVLRPDGYVGFRARMGYNVELMKYAAQDGITAVRE